MRQHIDLCKQEVYLNSEEHGVCNLVTMLLSFLWRCARAIQDPKLATIQRRWSEALTV